MTEMKESKMNVIIRHRSWLFFTGTSFTSLWGIFDCEVLSFSLAEASIPLSGLVLTTNNGGQSFIDCSKYEIIWQWKEEFGASFGSY
ncbi:hypothetical protein GmHk_10G029908 [Glycine max]|nr:hypothetical protein GmHk_10G029908 [Glycine max]